MKEAVAAKNYLSEREFRAMGQFASGYLDFAERVFKRSLRIFQCIVIMPKNRSLIFSKKHF